MEGWEEGRRQSGNPQGAPSRSGAPCELLQSILLDEAAIKMSRALISGETASHHHPGSPTCLRTCLMSVSWTTPHSISVLVRRCWERGRMSLPMPPSL